MAPAEPITKAEAGAEPRPVAAVITEWRKNSHADVILSRLLKPREWGHAGPFGLQLVAVYADQFPERGDFCRPYCHEHGIPIYPTIAGAIGRGSNRVAVDGVLLIGEHGDYPVNTIEQRLYPRRRLFDGIVQAFRVLGRRVPVFSDKHLSYEWLFARWMYDVARHEQIPLMAGSSLPVAWRNPELELPSGDALVFESAVGVGYADLDAYGFHALETLQCMVERRRGVETGVSWVQCLSGPAIDRQLAGDSVLVDQLNAVYRIRHGGDFSIRDISRSPNDALFRIQYRDGLLASVGMFNAAGPIFGFGGLRKGADRADAAIFELQDETVFGHFGYLLRAVEAMIQTGQPSYPVERTLLTTGLLSALLRSRAEGGRVIPTPHLEAVVYQAVDWPFARGPVGTPA
jgi:hypothetical protein